MGSRLTSCESKRSNDGIMGKGFSFLFFLFGSILKVPISDGDGDGSRSRGKNLVIRIRNADRTVKCKLS